MYWFALWVRKELLSFGVGAGPNMKDIRSFWVGFGPPGRNSFHFGSGSDSDVDSSGSPFFVDLWLCIVLSFGWSRFWFCLLLLFMKDILLFGSAPGPKKGNPFIWSRGRSEYEGNPFILGRGRTPVKEILTFWVRVGRLCGRFK